jgi:hypothetical protein
MNTTKGQLELSFNASEVKLIRMNPRHHRLARARWWFDQMHEVVDRAFDWSTGPAPRPEQIGLALIKAR